MSHGIHRLHPHPLMAETLCRHRRDETFLGLILGGFLIASCSGGEDGSELKLTLTPNIEYVGEIALVEKGVRSFGGSEQFRGEIPPGDYRVTVGLLDASMDVRSGAQYQLCGKTVDISLVGWTWNVVVERPGSVDGWVAVGTDLVDARSGYERLASGITESTTGLYLAVEVLSGLVIGAENEPALGCDFADARDELLAIGFAPQD